MMLELRPNCAGGFVPRPIRPATDRRTGVSRMHQAASANRRSLKALPVFVETSFIANVPRARSPAGYWRLYVNWKCYRHSKEDIAELVVRTRGIAPKGAEPFSRLRAPHP